MPHQEPIDDFDDLPTKELGAGLEVMPSEAEEKTARFRAMVAQASPKAAGVLGSGKQILRLADQGMPPATIAEKTGLTVPEVKSVTESYQDLDAGEKKDFKKFDDLSKNSVFNLYHQLQKQLEDLNADLKFLDDPELKIGFYAEKRQLFKLAKDVLQDVTFKKQQEEAREAELQIVLKFIDRIDTKLANELFKELREHRARQNLLS